MFYEGGVPRLHTVLVQHGGIEARVAEVRLEVALEVDLVVVHRAALDYEFQNKIGLAFRKHVYRTQGIIESDHIRAPGMKLDERSRAELEALIARVGLHLGASTEVA